MKARDQVKHTPGEWRADDLAGFVRADRGLRICSLNNNEAMIPACVRKANARLIAAAPELLVACQEAADYLMVSDIKHYRGIGQNLKAAIAKATT